MNKPYPKFITDLVEFRGTENTFKCYLCGKYLVPKSNFYSIVSTRIPNRYEYTCDSEICRDMCVLQYME